MMKKDDIEQLFRSNYRAMFMLAKRMLRDEDTARDIVHNQFAALLSGSITSVTSAYLMRGVRLACLNFIRNISTRERLRKLYALDLEYYDEENWPDDEMTSRLQAAIGNLPDKTRKVVEMRFSEGLSYKEIAREMAISEVAVYKHLRHAINQLRQNFKL